MAWVVFQRELYRLPAQPRFTRTGFRAFQETNRSREVLIYAPGGGHGLALVRELEYAGEEQKATRSAVSGRTEPCRSWSAHSAGVLRTGLNASF
jgi:hypothetical protein